MPDSSEHPEDRRQQPKPPKPQLLKPENAAKKLSIYLPATPDEFQTTPISRDAAQGAERRPARVARRRCAATARTRAARSRAGWASRTRVWRVPGSPT